jgi:NADH-quinone oxidoreductase subunit E
MSFGNELKEKIEKLKAAYPSVESAILPALYLIQREYGYIKDEHIETLSSLLGIQADYIYSTATFYTMFNLRPVGKFHLQVCKNISCSLMGARSIIDYLCEKLGIKPGETTQDGRFTISEVECLGACGGAPVMMVNEKYYENLSTDRIDKILEDCK